MNVIGIAISDMMREIAMFQEPIATGSSLRNAYPRKLTDRSRCKPGMAHAEFMLGLSERDRLAIVKAQNKRMQRRQRNLGIAMYHEMLAVRMRLKRSVEA